MARTHWTDWLADAIQRDAAIDAAPTPEAKIFARAEKMELLLDALAPLIESGEQGADNDIARRRWTQIRRMVDEARGINSGIVDKEPK